MPPNSKGLTQSVSTMRHGTRAVFGEFQQLSNSVAFRVPPVPVARAPWGDGYSGEPIPTDNTDCDARDCASDSRDFC
jgi:hypothetical protein